MQKQGLGENKRDAEKKIEELKGEVATEYHEMLSYAQSFAYSSFTELQKLTFCQPDVYDEKNDLFICGHTSSGKTLIPMLLYKRRLEQMRVRGCGSEIPKMLFVIPYRSLAAQKVREFRALFKEEKLTIIQSTGEFQQDDDAVQKGEVDIAVIIMEKVFKYASRDITFILKYDFFVIDEIGLIDNPERGIRLDFILSWAKRQRETEGKPRIIALGTPFYNWTAYIQSYHFFSVICDQRPVKLRKLPVIYSKQFGVDSVTPINPCLRRVRLLTKQHYKSDKELYDIPTYLCKLCRTLCPADELCRHDPTQLCTITGEFCNEPIEIIPEGTATVRNYILEQICRYHLGQDQQILIFLNDREAVKLLCRQLYHQLEDLLLPTEEPEVFRKSFLEKCHLEEDDVYGILEEENGDQKDMTYYRALSAGIGFHSRELPYELRTYVEEKFLESNELKIVCSTETLAFGVNSTVDVVVIADLRKTEGSQNRNLTLNEYKNYEGRAGRLSRTNWERTDYYGYVYTLISSRQRTYWQQMKEERGNPTPLYSKLYSDSNQIIAFALLNLMPEDGEPMLAQQVHELARRLPRPESYMESFFGEEVQRALNFLVRQRLVVPSRNRTLMSADRRDEVKYGLTKRGQSLRGFVIADLDYILIRDTIELCIDKIFDDINHEQLLYSLLSTQQLKSSLNGVFYKSETLMSRDDVYAFFDHRYSNTGRPVWLDKAQQSDDRNLYILAALLSWMEGASNKLLYIRFGVHNALLKKLAEQLGYLLEIARAMMPAVLDELWESRQQELEKFGIHANDFGRALEEKDYQMNQMFCAVFYGIDKKIWTGLLTFLEKQSDEESTQLRNKLLAVHITPDTARLLRRIVIRYRFFSQDPLDNERNQEISNNYRNQKWQYIKDIKEMGSLVVQFFEQALGITL